MKRSEDDFTRPLPTDPAWGTEDPPPSWQQRLSGLLPGTVVAVLLFLAVASAYLTGHPAAAIVIGIASVYNAVLAVKYWRLLSR